MTAEISGEKVVCHGVVHRPKEDKTALQAETETFGGAMKPLYVYFGDGKVLCGAENARLTVGGETFRVLYAEEKAGFAGRFTCARCWKRRKKMTGTELSAALAEKLKVLLPDCAVRPAFTGTLQRLPQRAAVTVGVMQEENADGVFETVLGVQLYARERDDHARLFDAVCAAVSSLPCALRSVKRSETTYSAALSCLVTLCTVQAATGAADNARAAVVIGDKVFTADAVKISHEAKVKRYYAIGEENPYAAVAGKAVYTIVLHGFSGGEEALPGEFTLQTGGARYTHCVLKAASENKLVIEAGACEKITQRTQSGTEA